MCTFIPPFSHRDPLEHLVKMNAGLVRARIKIQLQVHPFNQRVSYQSAHETPEEAYWGAPTIPIAWWVHSIFKRHPECSDALRRYRPLFASDPGAQMLFDTDRQVVVARWHKELFLLSMGEGILYESIEFLKELPGYVPALSSAAS